MQRKKEINLRLEACYEKAYVPNEIIIMYHIHYINIYLSYIRVHIIINNK